MEIALGYQIVHGRMIQRKRRPEVKGHLHRKPHLRHSEEDPHQLGPLPENEENHRMVNRTVHHADFTDLENARMAKNAFFGTLQHVESLRREIAQIQNALSDT